MKLRFFGHSDDLFECEAWGTGTTHDDLEQSGANPLVYEIKLGDAGLYVWGLYDLDGAPEGGPPCWVVGIQQLDEDRPLPPWPMRWSASGYSVVLEIEVPGNAVVKPVDKEEP